MNVLTRAEIGGSIATDFEPRDFLVAKKNFGVRVDAAWKSYDTSDPIETARVVGAYLQHFAACETWRLALDRDWGIPELHERMGYRQTQQTLRRKLNGKAPANFTDLGAWMTAVGRRSVVEVLAGERRTSGPVTPPTEDSEGSEKTS